MSGVSTGDQVTDFYTEAVSMLSYGFSGMLMLLASKIIFDKVSMHKFCMKKNFLIRMSQQVLLILVINCYFNDCFAYMSWDSSVSIIIVAYGWLLSQLALSIGTYIRIKLYKSSNGENLYQAIESGNTAVAIRFTGYRLSMAFAQLLHCHIFSYVAEDSFYLATMAF